MRRGGGGEGNGVAGGARGPVLRHELARSQQQRLTATLRDGVEMRPAVHLREKRDPARTVHHVRTALRAWNGAAQRLRTFPKLMRVASTRITKPDRPLRWTLC